MEGVCGVAEVRKKEQSGKEKRKRKRKKVKRVFLVVLKHSVTHSHFHCSSIKSFPSRIPQFPQNTSLSLSLWMNTQTHTALTHIYHANQQPSMSSPEFKSLPNSSFSFSKQHTQSPSLSLSQNNHFSCESSKSTSSSLLSHSSHCIQQRD